MNLNPFSLFKEKIEPLPNNWTQSESEKIMKDFQWKPLNEVVDMKKALFFLGDVLGVHSGVKRKFELTRYYHLSAVVFACVDAIAKAVSGGRPTLKILDKGQKVPLPDNHPAWELISKPNPFLTWNDIITALITDVTLAGESFAEVVVPEGRPDLIKEIWPLRTDLSMHFFGKDGIPDRLEFSQGDTLRGGRNNNLKVMEWAKGEYMCLKYYNPLDDTMGFSSTNTIARAISIYRHSDMYSEKFFKNNGAISAIIKPTGENRVIPENARKNLEKQLQEKYSGSSKAFQMAVLSGQYDFQKISTDPKDADMETIKRFTRDDILSAYGVPPVAVGYLDGATYANANIQIQRFFRGTIFPIARKSDDMWTKQIFQRLDPDIFYETDFSEIKELQEDKKTNAEVEKLLTDAGNRTRNEIRAVFGLQPIEGPDAEKGLKLPEKSQKPQFQEDFEETRKSLESKAKEIESKILSKQGN